MKRSNAKSLTLVARSVKPTAGEVPKSAPSARSKPTLWIRTAAGPTIGFGHLRRSLILARKLNRWFSPLFLIDSWDAWCREQLTDEGWHFSTFETNELWMALPKPVGILIDTRQENGLLALAEGAQQKGIPFISIHDLGLNPLPSDVVIDGSIFPVIHGFPRADTVFYTGTSYLVLDPKYGDLHRKRKLIGPKVKRIVINLGGGDCSRFFAKVLEGLRLWGRSIEVVGVQGFTQWGQVALARENWRPLQFRWAAPDEQIADLVFGADLAIAAGGMTSFEALCAGTPLLALSYDGFQQVTVSTLAKADACIDLGRGDLLKSAQIPPILTMLEADQRKRERLSFRGRQISDGRGAQRVSEIIRRLMMGTRASGSLEVAL